MFCNQCGIKLPDDVMFCPECGAKQEVADAIPDVAVVQNIQPVPEKKKRKSYKIFIPIGIILTVVILGFVFIFAGNRKSSSFVEVSKNVVFLLYDDFLNLNGEKIELTERISSNWYSGDGTVTVFKDVNDSLFYINNKMETVFVSDNVMNAITAVSGNYFAYTVYESEEYSEKGILYLYDTKNDKSIKISEDVFTWFGFSISPDGKTVAYLKNYEYYNDNTLYFYTLGKDEKKVDKDGCFPIGISEGGTYLYYVNQDNKLYCFDGKETEKIAADIDGGLWFNSSMSEMLFIKDGKTYFYNSKFKEAIRVCGSEINAVLLPKDDMRDIFMYVCCTEFAEIVGKDSLTDSVLISDSDLYWFNKEGTDTVKIDSDIDDYQLSKDGKSLLYLKNGELYKINKLNEEMKAKLLYDESYLYDFVASRDLSKVYIITHHSELLYLKGKNRTEEICESFYVSSTDNIAYNEASGKIFYIQDFDLYCAGISGNSVEKKAESVFSVSELFDGIFYNVSENGKDIYYYMEKEPVELKHVSQ